jgi:predicted restriction endonuclease
MKKLSSSRAKALQFSTDTIHEMIDRDKGCLFCQLGIHMDKVSMDSRLIFDPMHIVNKSQGGLGVIENGVIGCRGHHHLMDNSEFNEEMREIARDYLRSLYPGWTEEIVTYNKYKDLVIYRK